MTYYLCIVNDDEARHREVTYVKLKPNKKNGKNQVFHCATHG